MVLLKDIDLSGNFTDGEKKVLGKHVIEAARKKHDALMALYIRYGADLSVTDSPTTKYTALMIVVDDWDKPTEMVEFLIENGADVNALDRFGQSTLARALEKENMKVAQLLRESGAYR